MDNYNEMYNISSSIYKLHEKMASLEIQGKISGLEYNKLLEYLEICLEYEEQLYSNLDISKVNDILLFLNVYDEDFYNNLNSFRNHDCINVRLINKLLYFSRLHAKDCNNQDEADEAFNMIFSKMEVSSIAREEFIFYYLFILNEYINKCKSNNIKEKLINAKYRLSFMDVNIEKAMHATNYRLDIPVIRCNFSLNESLIDNMDLYNYVKEFLGESIFNNEMMNILNDDNDVTLILHQCAMRASMLMIDDDSKLADLNDEFHKYLENNGCNNKNEENIVKCFRKIKSDRENHFVNIR